MLYKICFLLFFSGTLLSAKEYRVVKDVKSSHSFIPYENLVKFEIETESSSRCEARIEFFYGRSWEGLVEVSGDCDVKKIHCLTENGVWLGNAYRRLLFDYDEHFAKGYSYKDVEFPEFFDTKFVEIVFDINECGYGYEYVDGRCVKIPEHSHLSRSGGWNCDYGYRYADGSCQELAVCSSGQYKVSDFECDDLPEHAHALVGGKKGWECDSGYHLETVGEFEICKEDPILNDLSAEIAGFIGGEIPVGTGLAFGGEIGLEWLFLQKKINLGPAVTIGVISSSHYNLSFLSTRLNLAFVFASKLDNIQFYLRPVVSMNLGTNVDFSEDNVEISYSVPFSTAGIEVGTRFWESSKERNFAIDLYLMFFSTIFRDSLVSDEKLIFLGMRFIFL